ncbi:MAG: zinc ribbon domain-containing protein [Candidatus Thermoplasmatota archaeon]
MKKIFIPPIIVLILMSLLAFWSAFRIQTIPEATEIPGATLKLTVLIAGVIITLCIILVTITGELKLEKIPAEKIVVEELPAEVPPPAIKPAEEVPIAEEVPKPAVAAKPAPEAEEMVVCGGCGALVPASSKTCPNCGAEFEE